MKVILIKDVAGVGQRGTVKEVADGYALNLLIPKGLAQAATAERLAAYEKEQAAQAAARAQKEKALAALVASVNGKTFSMTVRATDKGGLFKTIDADEIAKTLSLGGYAIPSECVKLEKPIKTVGKHEIRGEAHGGRASFVVEIVAA